MPVRSLTDRLKMPMLKGCAIAALLVLAYFTGQALASEAPKPVPIPAAHAKARATCPLDKPLKCRAALVHAYEAIAWQQKQNLELAREMVGKLTDWTCIHNGRRANGSSAGSGEGPWNANTGNGYYGGLQMDRSFMRHYGADMLRRHHGGLANTWTPREQLIVAQRAFTQGRGYQPWPTTGRACGLI